ncbi:MAG: type I-G CRISPR-associated helicase/endonuclease Cas3g [Nocardioidaceae bacterium]
MDFDSWVRTATGGFEPYDYQRRLAHDGLPQVLRVPTGGGKTLAAILPWLWRRVEHQDAEVRVATPRWLVFVLPLRTLVEQTVETARGWLDALGLFDEVPVHVLMGGAEPANTHRGNPGREPSWERDPACTTILVGTQDMLLSRALLRGYAEPRARWPLPFGMLHASSQWVFDETQLMGPGLKTSAQMQGLRDQLGTAAPTATMWMSATLRSPELETADHDEPIRVSELSEADRTGPLAQRLRATRQVRHVSLAEEGSRYSASLADALLATHQPCSRTIAVLNTVERAVALYDALAKRRREVDVVLLHSRFRPADRWAHYRRACQEPLGQAGRIVVATQVIEAGVDVSSRVLYTEAAPWTSIVQRAGRCNRAGEHVDAMLLWSQPPKGRARFGPYGEGDVEATVVALRSFECLDVTATQLQERRVDQDEAVHPVLRRRDLIDLFDTAPDLVGNDIDVSRWIRDGDDTTAFVAWRSWPEGHPAGDEGFPARAELCPAPLSDLRQRVTSTGGEAGKPQTWVYDQVGAEWRIARRQDVRPGAVLLLDADGGGYDRDRGWSPRSRRPVVVVPADTGPGDAIDRDEGSLHEGRWVPLADHLRDVEREVRQLVEEFGPLPGLPGGAIDAAVVAGLYHDLGKCHPAFQEMLTSSVDQEGVPGEGGPWAKSPGRGGRHVRRHFRHELVSALMLLDPSCRLLDGVGEPDLVAYLAAAHHGKVRMSVRSYPDEVDADPPQVLGVQDGDRVGPLDAVNGVGVPELRLDTSVLQVGAGADGRESWTGLCCHLRDRPDLGPFRLGFLEAVVRLADWRASASYDREAT